MTERCSCFLTFCTRSSVFCTSFFFFFNDTATTEIYTLSLHDALPICTRVSLDSWCLCGGSAQRDAPIRSEEHTSELQSPVHLVCRLLLEKKKKKPFHLHSFPQPHLPHTEIHPMMCQLLALFLSRRHAL